MRNFDRPTLSQYSFFQVSKEIVSSGYDSKHFTIALGLPVSLALRSHSLNLYLEDKLEIFDEEDVTPIKQVIFSKLGRSQQEQSPGFKLISKLLKYKHNCFSVFLQVWKWLFPQRIAQRINKSLVTGDVSEFYAELQFEFDADEEELSCL